MAKRAGIPLIVGRNIPVIGAVEEDGSIVTFSGGPLPEPRSSKKKDVLRREATKKAREERARAD
jgi:hypothetical protein